MSSYRSDTGLIRRPVGPPETVPEAPTEKSTVEVSTHALPQGRWPESCKYYDRNTTNGNYLGTLLLEDSLYFPPASASPTRLEYIDILDGKATLYEDPADAFPFEERLRVSPTARRSTKVFFVAQKRLYYRDHSVNSYALHSQTWEELLDRLSVLPSFLELLHSNNGGFASSVSYCADNARNGCQKGCTEESISAFHLGIKIGDWGNSEHAVYARHDFHTGHEIVLVVGTKLGAYPRHLVPRINAGSRFDFMHVLLDLTSSWLHEVEAARWGLDYRTQDIEARTGFSSFHIYDVAPLPPERLTFTQDVHVAADSLRNVAWGSARVEDAFSFLQDQLGKFDELGKEAPEHRLPLPARSHLQNALMQQRSLARHQLLQLRELQGRVDSQLSVTKTLIAQRDTQINIEIARATKRDSELMKGIAAVTMVFLPATFAATFFSMVFFHVGDERTVQLVVERHIWMYPLVTIPLTLIVMAWYWSVSWNLGQLFRRRIPTANAKR